MSQALDVSVSIEPKGLAVPDVNQFVDWANAAYLQSEKAMLCIKVVDREESAELNSVYRHKSGPTNVLSFPMVFPADIADTLDVKVLGDIAICAAVVEDEAIAQNKSLDMHWAHMVIHGVLHLQGYDHIEDQAAAEMEQLEVKIMTRLGYKNPYQAVSEVVLD